MKEIRITLWYHDEEKDWTIQLNGMLHSHISAQTVDELVEYSVMSSQQAIIERPFPISEVYPRTSVLAN